MSLITYFNKQEPILFAVEELKRLLRKAGIESSIEFVDHLKDSSRDYNRILLITKQLYESLKPDSLSILNTKQDGFAILKQGSNTWIIGEEPRSVLYGVYKYCEMYLGYDWTHLDQENIVSRQIQEQEEVIIFVPKFQRRGNVIETIDDPIYINSLIDWGVKNGHNEYFFTFFLWEKIKDYVTPSLKRRGVKVTLGGHSLQFLLKEIEIESDKKENLQFFTKDKAIQNLVIQKILDICQENEVISRISLWPEDIGIGEKNGSDFISSYVLFTENLNNSLESSGRQVEVEHIVYNAGLSWNMLERDSNTAASSMVDVLYAYWGRDYADSINAKETNQKRAIHALNDWNSQVQQGGRGLTVLEYYSDHFMLSELFPPLARRIEKDLFYYHGLNLTGILNLIVPIHNRKGSLNINNKYPWKWIQHFNNYIYTRLAWGESLDLAMDRYFQSYTDYSLDFKQVFLSLEELISPHTKWNVPFFPARVVDSEEVKDRLEYENVINYLEQITQYFKQWNFKETEMLLSIQSKDNYQSFSSWEMANIYFYYLKNIAEKTLQEWTTK